MSAGKVMTVQICETVTADTMEALRAARDRATAGDLVELRLDGVADIDVDAALEGRRGPVVVTCRPTWEGGRFAGPEEDRCRILIDAARRGADYVDVESKTWDRVASEIPRQKLVLSHHDFDGTPADLADRVRAMRAIDPAVTKVAVTAKSLRDVIALRNVFAGDDAGRHVAIAMGPAGAVTRVLPSAFGSCWTYAGSAAPGQLPAWELIDTYRVRRTTADTHVYGIVGKPLAHSASPAMHNAAFAASGADAVYVPFECDDASEVNEAVAAFTIKGLSVTAPLKGALYQLSEHLGDVARSTAAVNTLRFGPRGIEGRNFDVDGFLAPLRRRDVSLDGRRAVVLGAGGAARAAVCALRREGAEVEVAARQHAQAVALAGAFEVGLADWPPAPDWALLVNATPVGTWPETSRSPLAQAEIRGGFVYDLVYNPTLTTLLKFARREGVAGIGGLEMLVGQAVLQHEWWTGHRPDEQVMSRAASAFMTMEQVT